MKIEKSTSLILIYEWILWYLEKGNRRQLAECFLRGNIQRFKNQENPPSWDLTEESLTLLDRCVNESGSLNDETWTEVRNNFIIAAFKDLSTFRNPKAMVIFEKLRTILTLNEGELLLWARTITKRPDGSGVIVMHVSDMEAFEGILNRKSGDGFLQDGLMIYR